MGKVDKGKSPAPVVPSSNWAKLQKTLPVVSPKDKEKSSKQKKSEARRAFMNNENAKQQQTKSSGLALGGISKYIGQTEFGRNGQSFSSPIAGPSRVSVPGPSSAKEDVILLSAPAEAPFSALVDELRIMVAGKTVLNEAKKAIALDCEMVGTGPNGSESALARVSIVNYHGHILLDTFVQPREKVTDWRTWISGVRESDVVGAPSFEEVQKQVAELCEGRIVVGHAVDNDLKILLLSHPSPLIRNTQRCKMLREKAKSKHPGLKKLSEMELGIRIQQGSHSSVTDARATMGLYRLYKIEWEKQLHHTTEAYRAKVAKGKKPDVPVANGKRKRDLDDEDGDDNDDGEIHEVEDENERNQSSKKGRKSPQQFPGGGRKGISSGLGLVIRKNGKRVESGGGHREEKDRRNGSALKSASGGNWWETVDE
ncbi:uncharacterized protein I303_103035 [Kwoniella dejecticola CBS 10117]|uniref:RNA exonuclease 4 n=1 Tax=Kwoniella dejecticola CBS 10117 TaxID=1296121 RepID=A0AAJ8KMK5_9TREE